MQLWLTEDGRETSSPKAPPEVQPFPAILQAQEYRTPREPLPHFSGNEANNGRNSWSRRTTPEVQQEFIYNEPELEQPSISIETLEQFSSEDYQQLLTAMVSRISSAVLSESVVSAVPFLEDSRGGKNRASQLVQGGFSRDAETLPILRCEDNFYQRCSVPRPSNFSISSVDPLHFLGITPTVQSAELLQACKSISH